MIPAASPHAEATLKARRLVARGIEGEIAALRRLRPARRLSEIGFFGMLWIAGIFSLLVAAAGWFYLFYSRAASKLVSVEGARTNSLRIRLRRVGGTAMILLGAVFYVACDALNREQLAVFSGLMLAVLALMATTLVLGIIDLRLTRQLRKTQDRVGKE